MRSLVTDLQRDILNSKKSVTEILRTTKLISAKLGLSDISQLIESELSGYTDLAKVPAYREISGGNLYYFNPVRGWCFAGPVPSNEYRYRTPQPVSELEELAKGETVVTTPPGKFQLSEPFLMQCPQQVRNSTTEIKRILEAIREEILNWAIELEQKGITGDGMSFDTEEKRKAQNQTFNIQHFAGVLGNVTNSTVNIYDYSSIHQQLRESGVPQLERNELENILDELKKHPSAQKKRSLIESGKAWIARNQEILGADANIIRQTLGIPNVT
jgi:AbiTii-like protein